MRTSKLHMRQTATTDLRPIGAAEAARIMRGRPSISEEARLQRERDNMFATVRQQLYEVRERMSRRAQRHNPDQHASL